MASVLLWFKRDLRVADHAALARAVEAGDAVLPLYIAEPEMWAERDASARQWAFIAECLAGLREETGRLGAPLVVRMGGAVEVLSELCARHGISRIISHEETGNAWTFARDRAVAAWAGQAGVAWQEVPQVGVVRRLNTRDGWAARREREIRQPQIEAPGALSGLCEEPGGIPGAVDLGLATDPCPERQIGGRDQALSLLGGFMTERGRTYRAAMSTPLEGEWACSRLSPYLAHGAVSMREVAQAGLARAAEVKGTREGWTGSMRSFQARLAWRGHFMQKLEDEPAIEHRCLHSAYEGMRPAQPDATRLAAWERGETGLPFVDACMRYLAATGWLNFRMRAMLVAVASYHLWLDWRVTGAHLARQFTDFEAGIHWPQTQMQSGTTGMNTIRIYNPVKQGQDQDPEGIFTRRWVPELAGVPDKFLQAPWTWEGAGAVLGRTYPEPIVEPVAAAREAREKVWAVRRGAGFRDEAARVVKKHASRKEGTSHFVNDREKPKRRGRKAAKPAKTSGGSGQMSLDL
ncbi:MAG: FAD-binding domain-containing protein [Pseudomonadota bacterium]